MTQDDTPTGPEIPLADRFRRLIRNTGPMSLATFMGESNARYYGRADPLGRNREGTSGGDFVTAPEISQMFGELIGLWLADIWVRAGRPDPVHYVELGPGRGTLAKDALRSARKYGLEPRIHFVEISQPLKDIQLEMLPGAIWHDDVSTLPMDYPLLVVANEFFDALPVRQLVKTPDGWRERMVALDENDAFMFAAGTQVMDAAVPEGQRDAEVGTIVETCPAAAAIAFELAGRLAEQNGCALFVDYGYDTPRNEPRTGSTLQAVQAHKKVGPFDAPGAADMTAHVDLGTLARIAQSRDVKHLGTVGQGKWLHTLGIAARAEALKRAAPHYRAEIDTALQRLTAPDAMGNLFKVMGLVSQNWPEGAGFAPED
ncbi:MAG: SAM-dependent methyltransferase [Parerythrobacter sp.]